MNINMPKDPQFNKYYRKHQKCLNLNGLQPKTIEAYSRAIRRIGNYFDCRIDNLTSDQLLDYFNELLDSHYSCGHRNCPHCQNHENSQWIENQLSKRLPDQYYLITFTLPEQLKNLAWRNQATIYSLVFACIQDLLKTFTHNDKKIGGAAGFTTILHMDTCVQKTACSASESLFYQENLFQRSYVRKQKIPCFTSV